MVCLPTGPNAVEGVFGSNDLQMVPNIIATVIGKGYVGIRRTPPHCNLPSLSIPMTRNHNGDNNMPTAT